MVVVCGCGSGYRSLAHDRDAKLATLIHPSRPRNQQVRALHIEISVGVRLGRSHDEFFVVRGSASVITVVIGSANAGG